MFVCKFDIGNMFFSISLQQCAIILGFCGRFVATFSERTLCRGRPTADCLLVAVQIQLWKCGISKQRIENFSMTYQVMKTRYINLIPFVKKRKQFCSRESFIWLCKLTKCRLHIVIRAFSSPCAVIIPFWVSFRWNVKAYKFNLKVCNVCWFR